MQAPDRQDGQGWETDRVPSRSLLPVVLGILVVVGILLLLRSPAETSEDGLAVDGAVPTPVATVASAVPTEPPPAVGTWRTMQGAPFIPTAESSGVWAGDRVLVWDHSDTGAMFAYDPITNLWEQLDVAPQSTAGGHIMVWTGESVLIWGGRDVAAPGVTVGLSFSVEAGWSRLPDAPLSSRTRPGGAWDADRGRLVVWGGLKSPTGSGLFAADGAAFDPQSGEWTPLPDLGLAGRDNPSVVAMATGVAIMGGTSQGASSEGGTEGRTAQYDGAFLIDDRVVPIPPLPVAMDSQLAIQGVSTTTVLAWGRPSAIDDPPGYFWRPSSGWESLTTATAEARADPNLVLSTGSTELQTLLIVFGGLNGEGPVRRVDGFWLDLATRSSQAFPPAPLSSRARAVAVSTGTDLIVWGGAVGSTYPRNGALLRLPSG